MNESFFLHGDQQTMPKESQAFEMAGWDAYQVVPRFPQLLCAIFVCPTLIVFPLWHWLIAPSSLPRPVGQIAFLPFVVLPFGCLRYLSLWLFVGLQVLRKWCCRCCPVLDDYQRRMYNLLYSKASYTARTLSNQRLDQ